ncbi:hypothetical protein LCGC14_0273590 [marine sediment metagenome]|uniref:Uncharacterized protein n=2 Tax=root TaxID=1 RepID=A0A9C9TJA5_9HYPH|nr:hypothetical protein [Aurantimonas coralicida]
MPNPLVIDIRGQTPGVGPARVGTLDGGLFFSQIGTDLIGSGGDLTQNDGSAPQGLVSRFRGILYAFAARASTFGRIWPYDEGGIDDWVPESEGVPQVAKGGQGRNTSMNTVNVLSVGGLVVVNTENQDYLVGVEVNFGSNVVSFHRYNPDDSNDGQVGGRWDTFTSTALAADNNSAIIFVHNGLVHFMYSLLDDLGVLKSFDPVTGGIVNYTRPFDDSQQHGAFFTLYDRLFALGVIDTGGAFPHENECAEFALGVWTVVLTTAGNFGHLSNRGSNVAVFQLSPTKVLAIGSGGSNVAAGLLAALFTTVGDSPTGALQVTDVTDPVIPPSLRDGAPPPPDPQDYRCFGHANTSDPLGTLRHFMFFHPDGAATVTPSTLFEVIDELTEIVSLGAPQSDSNFAFPVGFYGGGEQENGIDGSTRLVTVSPRGWAAGTTGLRVRCSAHGDAPVLAHGPITVGTKLRHGVVTAGPFQFAEVITGSDSGATGTVSGFGSNGVTVTPTAGTFVGGEVITGGTSGASAILGMSMGFETVPFVPGEILTGGTSLATAVVVARFKRTLPTAGLLTVEVSTIVGGPFTAGETLTGSIGGGTATLAAPPPAEYEVLSVLTGLTSGATAIISGDGANEGLYVREVIGTFAEGEEVEDDTGTRSTLDHVLQHGAVTLGPFQVAESILGGTSGATADITHLGIGGAGEQLVKVDNVAGGPFQNGEVITGGTSGASAPLSAAPAGVHGGLADKTIRARFFLGAGPSGKGIPLTGFATMVAGSGFKGTVSKGSGPGGSDELINVIADGTVGGDIPPSFEWDFLADGVPKFLVTSMAFEIDRV